MILRIHFDLYSFCRDPYSFWPLFSSLWSLVVLIFILFVMILIHFDLYSVCYDPYSFWSWFSLSWYLFSLTFTQFHTLCSARGENTILLCIETVIVHLLCQKRLWCVYICVREREREREREDTLETDVVFFTVPPINTGTHAKKKTKPNKILWNVNSDNCCKSINECIPVAYTYCHSRSSLKSRTV